MDVRSQSVGLANVSTVCSVDKYAVLEEIGGFAYISVNIILSKMSFFSRFFSQKNVILKVATHVIGNILGAYDDGTSAGSPCSTSTNNLMAPPLIYNTLSNTLNQFIFSSCSINSIKQNLLTSDLG